MRIYKKKEHELERLSYIEDVLGILLLAGGLPGRAADEHRTYIWLRWANALGSASHRSASRGCSLQRPVPLGW